MKKLVTAITLTFGLMLGMQLEAMAQLGPPTVNGLFYAPVDSDGNYDADGIPDKDRYSLYSTTENGSKLYYNVTNGTLYVALVVDPENVNDNTFDLQGGSGDTPYMESAGWDTHRALRRLIDSEFAQFTLTVGEENNQESWTWKQGYAGQPGVNHPNVNNNNATWVSGVNVAGGVGDETPPMYQAASSLAWNMNNYAENYAGNDSNWNMPGSSSSDWKSPWKGIGENFDEDEDSVPSDFPNFTTDGIEWEWHMVYEWSVDLNQIAGSKSPIFLLSGASHHSPSKKALTGDCPEDSDDDCFEDLKGAIGDFVWNDLDGDGIQDEGEPGVEGVTVKLFDANEINPENYDESDLENYITKVETDSNGKYLFTELDEGNYIVWFEQPDGFQFTQRFAGDNTDIDSDASRNPGFSEEISLDEGELRFDIDAGLIETTTTIEMGGSCYRMLSSPAQTTYSSLLANIWTQGADIEAPGKENHIQAGENNVLLWDVESTWSENNGSDGSDLWTFPSNLTVDELPAGAGFLLGLYDPYFEDADDPDSAIDGPYEMSADGPEHGSGNNNGLVEAPVNTNPGGWTLAGNPYFTTIDINKVFDESHGLTGVIYIWDRERELAGSNGWRTFSIGNGNGLEGAGDIPDGLVHPYQGFFVQTVDSPDQDPELNFTNNAKSAGAEFYGKERSQASKMRLQVTGEKAAASTWLVFSESGSFERLSYDAFEMDPLSSEYMMLASRKTDGTLFDIGYYPTPTEDFEIPIAVETSMPGTYTITASDLNLSLSQDLYFVDRETDTTVPIDDSFSYEFTISSNAAKIVSPNENKCSMGMTQMSKSAGNDRFMITTSVSDDLDSNLPQDVELKQNYPNPFNPTTSIQYQLPQSANVTLEVYNMLGQRVTVLAEGQQTAGSHTVEFDASSLSSGVYIYRLTAGSTVINKRMTLVK